MIRFKNKRDIFIVIIIIFISGGIYLSLNYNAYLETPDLKPKPEIEADAKFKEIGLSLYNNMKDIKWELKAEELVQYEDRDYIDISPIELRAIQVDNKEFLYSLAASRGIYLVSESKLDIEGPVKITKDKLEIITQKLIWEKEKNLLTGSGIEMNSDSFFLTGEGFESDFSLNRFIVYGNEKEQVHFFWRENK
jgi:LPS export ABC transporter protein LptC